MSHLYCCRLDYDTWRSLVGGILPFGAHTDTDPVFRIKLSTKLSATRCQNQHDNRNDLTFWELHILQ
jgi:hypothetical protein